MIIIISKIIFVASILGILFIVFRKFLVLSQLPEGSLGGRFSLRAIFAWFRITLREFIASNFFQNTIIGNLEKSLRKFKIMFLKIDNIADKLLRKLKRNSGK